jgi:dienelactone hydrolase
MQRARLGVSRSMATAAITGAIAAGLVAVLVLRDGGNLGNAEGVVATPVTLEISVPATGTAGAGRQRSYKLDVWIPPRVRPDGPVPLVVYITGWASVRSNNKALLTAASDAGYAVLALDDISQDQPYDDALDEAARKAPFDLATEAHTRLLMDAARRKAALQVAKVSDLLDRLIADQTLVPQFAGLGVRYDRVGILGYSFGGATAAELSKRDPRVKAAVNIDGWQLGASADQIVEVPFLMINSAEARLNPADERLPDSAARNEAVLNAIENERQMKQAAARSDSYRLYLRSARHGDFSDEVGAKRRVLAWLKSRGQLITARATRRALDAMIVAFFDAHLRDSPSAPIPKVLAAHPDWIVLGAQPFH